MTLEKRLENAKKRLEKHHQSHLLAFWNHLEQPEKQNLLEQIEQLDFTQIDNRMVNIIKNPPEQNIPQDLKPAHSYPPEPADRQQNKKYNQAGKLGSQLISREKIAAFVVAGGQGTRLGFDGPKGEFKVTPVKNKPLFQLFAEYIESAQKKYQAELPWYIMTSPMNHQKIKRFFEQNNYFGLKKQNVFIFRQGTLPNFRFDGKILLKDKANIASSPDGHGGSLKALYKSGALRDMLNRGIEHISYLQVDNPLVHIFDPLFIGLHALENAQMSAKAIQKEHPKEKIGVFAISNGRLKVIEYSDLPDHLAKMKNPDNTFTYGLGSPAIHIISTSFVRQLNKKGFELPLHRAVKKIPHIDETGKQIQPSQPNGIKLEHFVFDALPLAQKTTILETKRDEEFAPVKNATGADSPQSSRELQINRHANWLESAGIKIPRKNDGSPDCTIEIAPSFAIYKEDVKQKTDRIPNINPGEQICLE